MMLQLQAPLRRHTYRYFSNTSKHRTSQMFEKVLIANRGEIACRIMKTCKKLGIRTVGVYSTADSKSSHVQMADEAICLGPPSSLESYLNIDRVCSAIEESQAQAVAPGYGFLSENAEFARRVRDMGIAFVGPPAEAIDAMGDKITSKQIAIDAGVNTIPGFQGVLKDADHAIKLANEIGYPVMVKATSGGGGKGMRICYNDRDVKEGFILSSAEAIQSFGDGRLFIERFIECPHHIEFQIVAATDDDDKTTEVLVFPERECSIQRRNQKVLEESPSILLNKVTRREMSRQATLLAKAVGYASAGTIEFLVEGKNVSNDQLQNFYFLEMNTRLQVEHPVTEMITSIDLVEQMLRVAANKYFANTQGKETVLSSDLLRSQRENIDEGVVPYKGWALEARIYAEDPLRNFLPSIGPILKYEEPSTKDVSEMMGVGGDSITVRVDSGVNAGSNISMFYDPMISKLVTYSNDSQSNSQVRRKSIDAMMYALQRYVVVGVQNNMSFLSHVVSNCEHNPASRAFRAGNTPTNFIDTHYPNGFSKDYLNLGSYSNETGISEETAAIVISATIFSRIRQDRLIDVGHTLYRENVIVVIGGIFGTAYEVQFGNDMNEPIQIRAMISSGTGSNVYQAFVEGMNFDNTGKSIVSDFYINEKQIVVQLHETRSDNSLKIQAYGLVLDVIVQTVDEYFMSRFMKKPTISDTSSMLISPMPGRLTSLAVNVSFNIILYM